MRQILTLSILLFSLISCNLNAQNDYYYPPVQGNEWETVSAEELNWCPDAIPDLLNYVEEKNGKGFLVLHKGKIVIEEYFDEFEQDSVWYWASAGKSLVAFLTGMAQANGLLNINDPTSDYLGQGWTNMSVEQEAAITIRHQMTMCTGIDYNVDDLNCLEAECLNYLQDPDQNFYYHNAPYRLLQDVLANASGQGITAYTFAELGQTVGITGLWVDYVFFSKPRSMARFGLLNLSNGNWDGTPILDDAAYMNAMTSPSQTSNPAYGYLWWLNGQESYKLPGVNLNFTGELIPSAPADMYAALGKNDQKIYVVPSLDLVVVRVGDSATEQVAALSDFDEMLWTKIMDMICLETSATSVLPIENIKISPQPASDYFYLETDLEYQKLQIINAQGQVLKTFPKKERYDISDLTNGLYFAKILDKNTSIAAQKIILNRTF